MLETLKLLIDSYTEWLYYFAIISIIFLIVSLLFVPYLITRIPEDYFIVGKRKGRGRPITWKKLILLLIRTIIGSVLMITGIVLLVLPGQGLLTILAGIFILEFPGKYRLERYLVQKPVILNSLNWIRRRYQVNDIRIT